MDYKSYTTKYRYTEYISNIPPVVVAVASCTTGMSRTVRLEINRSRIQGLTSPHSTSGDVLDGVAAQSLDCRGS